MNFVDLIVEIIEEFEEITLVNFFVVSKKLHVSILNIFRSKLKNRHSQCIEVGDDVSLDQFCGYYMKRLVHGPINFSTGTCIDYDYCTDCELFGSLTITNFSLRSREFSKNFLSKICKFGCHIICCGEYNIIPQT